VAGNWLAGSLGSGVSVLLGLDPASPDTHTLVSAATLSVLASIAWQRAPLVGGLDSG
jgi:hypothetical protein